MPDAFPRGKIVWHDLMTTDTRAAISFYGKLMGWGTMPFDKDPSYLMWTNHGEPLGGVVPLPEESRRMGTPPSWLMYVGVPSVETTVQQARTMGARVLVGPGDIPDGGRYAIVADPQGAVFAVYSGTQPTPDAEVEPKPGEFSWHELVTNDWQAAWRFYEPLFGWVKADAMDMGPAGIYQMFSRKGRLLGGMYNRPPDVPAPNWLCYASVNSADDAAAKTLKLGAKVVQGPMEVPGGDRIAVILDPQGASFALHSRSGAAKPKKKSAKKKPAKAKKKPAKKKAVKKQAAKKKTVRCRRR